ncbi:hypothetical protein BH11CYA1_BH11CYA1_09570 [soil metagenome]
MGTQNSDEIMSYLANKEPLAAKTKKQIISDRETQEKKRSADVAMKLMPSQWSAK